MPSPVRRNSSKPYIDSFRNGSLKNGGGELDRFRNFGEVGHETSEPNIPNVMTSPAIFPIQNGGRANSVHSDLKDIDEDSFSASSVTDVPRPPDGGWGWFVVFASFMIHVLGKKILIYLIK